MLTAVDVENWLRVNSDELKYSAPLPLIPFIKRDGILSRRKAGTLGQWHGDYSSRPNHVYLWTSAGRGASIQGHICTVSLRGLQPELVDSDEDWCGAHGFSYPNESLDRLPGFDRITPRTSTEDGGCWADRHSMTIDQPSWVLHSMNEGTLAYRGWIPPEQVTIIPDQAQLWDKAPPDAVHQPKVWRERPPFLHESAIWDCERQTAYAR